MSDIKDRVYRAIAECEYVEASADRSTTEGVLIQRRAWIAAAALNGEIDWLIEAFKLLIDFKEPIVLRHQNVRWPWLALDAPDVPEGYAPHEGVIHGCGDAWCADCYKKIEK